MIANLSGSGCVFFSCNSIIIINAYGKTRDEFSSYIKLGTLNPSLALCSKTTTVINSKMCINHGAISHMLHGIMIKDDENYK